MLKRKVHRETGLDLTPPARLDLWAALLAGGIIAGTIAPRFALALVFASLIVTAGVLLSKDLVPEPWRPMAVTGPLFVAGGVAIAALHAAAADPLTELAVLDPGEVIVVGEIISPVVPATGFGYRTDLRVEHLWYEDREVLRGGAVQVQAGDLRTGVGDRVRVDGELSKPESSEDGFDYARYLSTKGISAIVTAGSVAPVDDDLGWIGRVHRQTDVALSYGLRPKEASIVRGMLFGDRSRIPEDVEEDFQRSGIAHILAISGQHVAVLAAMAYFLLRAFAVPVAARNPATLGLVWLYVVIAGAPPSAVRAAVVATLVLAAPIFNRQLSPLHFMTTMLAVVLAYNPALIFSTGFQLSVAAVFGILLLRKPFKEFVRRTVLRPFAKPPSLLADLLSISLAAQVATAPIIASTFEEVSVIGTLTNLVAVPLSGPILSLGLFGAAAGTVAPALAYPLNASNGFLVSVLEWTAHTASALPFAVVTTPGITLPLVALFYAGCAPAVIACTTLPEERWPRISGLLLLWTALWLTLSHALGG